MARTLNQPTGLRLVLRERSGSTSMISTPARVRMTSGRMRASCMLAALPIAWLAGEKRGRCWMGDRRRTAQRVHAAVDGANPVRREDTHDDHECSHGPQRQMLARPEVGCGRAMDQRRL